MLRLQQHVRYNVWRLPFNFNVQTHRLLFPTGEPAKTFLCVSKQTRYINTLFLRAYQKANMTDTSKMCDQVKMAEESLHLPKTALQTDPETQSPSQAESSQKVDEKPLPKLTPAEFRAYNRLAVVMDQYHNHFRSTWTELITGLKTSRPKNQSLRQFLSIAQGFCRMLSTHHDIEESYVFPILAKKMPAFQKHNKEHGEMIKHHRQIHKGLDKFEEYVDSVRDGEKDFVASEMLEIMESFEKVLWEHLDQEVQQLGAENMRKYWTIDELKMLPM
ncbi:hypothetical protein AA313_de0202844 [Arthrobotrys entomopaga]|nr:hypothetical protein AA313_de0202844 [Arthrobotrys entomopaga]